MEKRERILLGVMAATLLAAGGMYLSGPSQPAAPAGRAALAAVGMGEMVKSVEQSKLTPEQTYRLTLLAQNATGDPFYGGASGITQDDPQGASEEQVYSGFIKVGQRVLAVINGIEYACGDKLAEGGYVVQSIDKNAVVLERADGSTGRKYTKRVPLVEDDADKIRIRVVKKR